MLKTILKRVLGFGVIGMSVLLILIFNPSLLYANKTMVLNHMVYHDTELSPYFKERLHESLSLIKTSELYDDAMCFDICLDKNSTLPQVMNTLKGPAYGWGFFNQIVLKGDIDYKNNTIAINGYKWNLSQLMAHELTHCLQTNAFGFWNSNPVANYETWKWEGYPEYIARQHLNQLDLEENIDLKLQQELEGGEAWAFKFNNGTIAPRTYYNHWIMVQYCLEIKKMTYRQLLNNKTLTNEILEIELLDWYKTRKKE